MIGNIKIIAVCMCKVYDERNYRIIRALNNFAVENDYRLFVYHTCSDLYWKTLSEKGEQSVFDLIDYNITDAVVTFEEGVYAENVMTKIRMDAAKYGKPVISVGVEHDDCISIKFGYAKGFEQVVRHVIEQHGVRDIGFIAGRKDEENSEERIAVFRKLLEEYDIPFRNDVFYYGDYWSVPALKAVDDMIEKNKIYNEDCLIGMKKIEDKTIDLILTDLPYGITKNSKDTKIPTEFLWKEYKRIIKDNGAICLFAQGKFYIELVAKNLEMFRYDLVWNKGLTSGFLNANRQPLRKHEQIAVFYKKSPTYNPQFSIGEPLHGKGVMYKNKQIVNNNYGSFRQMDDKRKGCRQKYPTSILEFKKSHPSIATHPTEKPISLLEYLIKTYTNIGDLVLDSCIGSGNTIIACKNTYRNYIGFEIDKEYYDIATNRIGR